MKPDVWTILYTLIAAGVGSFTTWKASSLMWTRRLSRVERQTQAALMLAMEMGVKLNLDESVLRAARKALGPADE